LEKELERAPWMVGKQLPGESNLVRPVAMNKRYSGLQKH
jgi:hypothetical protein